MSEATAVPEHVMEFLREHFNPGVAEQWLERKVPAFDDLTAAEWVAAGKGTWDDVVAAMRRAFTGEVTD